MNRYSNQAESQDAKHTISFDRIFRRHGDEDDDIYAPEDMGKAYKVSFSVNINPSNKSAAKDMQP